MKKLLLLALTLTLGLSLSAQTADFKKSVAKYKNLTTLSATATRTVHKAGTSKDKVVAGTLTVKNPGKVAIVNGKDALIMNGNAFTMKKGPIKAKTDAATDSRYKTFHDVLEAIFNGGKTDLTKNADVKISKSGTNVVLTITPTSQKKMMFSSFIITIDGKAQEMRSIRLMQKAGAYTEYQFSNYKLGATIDEKIFK
ncbi:MAG: outer membrane lipoprotein carrier protein LolA [Prevotella sp.]|nr:outer membrane lipoprotein carrier protein LolA [Prevotella sp.]